MLDRAASMAATEVMIEIRSGVHPRELVLPLDVEGAATFYYNDKHCTEDRIRSSREAAVGDMKRNVEAGHLVLLGHGIVLLDLYCLQRRHVFITLHLICYPSNNNLITFKCAFLVDSIVFGCLER